MNTDLLTRLAHAEAAAHRQYGRTGEAAQFGPLVAVHAGPNLPLNVAWHDGTRPPTAEELEALEAFSDRHEQPATLHLLSAFAALVLPLLKERGYALEYVLHAYTHDLTHLPALSALTVREAKADAWAALAARGFGPGAEEIMSVVAHTPGARLFVADTDAAPAANAALSLTEGVAAFYGTAALPEFQGRGLQTALLAHRLNFAAQAGADLASVFVTPGSGSERNVQRAGFRLAGMRLTLTRVG
ncbi:GNAT family N-acetyltransferase [Deinococcus arenicola]|uniref:GNAT family N-acetyltransferase n=1 Tax=Deinococcus arenicola TaxID=2994950 RepID=A0ABU4DRW8_9DEIO|nr:GNAT family N-acetyltransferase [Deinococcus sp. ZS9-10]MDV6374434.1 GNAT family N-acetyltransferase [Deinococcus sp. ZS9-10]